MHVPDGFISPKMYLPAYVVAAGLWAWGLRRARAKLDEETVPYIAVMTALSFVLMMVTVPMPGGTSVHATGIALLAILFGPWTAFLSVSLVLLLQAILLGAGGITSLPVNALALGLAGGTAAAGVFKIVNDAGRRIDAQVVAHKADRAGIINDVLYLGHETGDKCVFHRSSFPGRIAAGPIFHRVPTRRRMRRIKGSAQAQAAVNMPNALR